MAQLTWENMNPIDTSRYLDAIQKAQATSLAGVEQIGKAYQGYYDNLKKQNTNDMLAALNQARNPEELAIAQANIAAMQDRWGSGYDMDAVRTAMDERPAVLMQRQSAEMDFKDKQANIAARPNASAIRMAQLKSLNATDEQLAQIKAIDDMGADSTAIAESLGQFLTNDRSFKFDKEKWEKDYNQKEDHYTRTLNQNAYQFGQTNDRANRESAWKMGQDAYNADQASGAGTTYVAADGTEYTTGGSGGASIAGYASMFMPRGIQQAIFRGESGGDYDTLYGNSHKAGGRFAGVKLTDMTVNEALEFSKAGGEYARWSKTQKGVKPGTYATPMGAYQIVGTTLETAAKALGLKGNERMTPELQDRLGDYIYQTQGTGAWKGYRGPTQGGGGYKPSNAATNTPASVPLVGIDRKVQQKIRGEYQDAMLKYNEDLALKDQPVNVGNVLAGLTAKEKGSTRKQDAFDIANAIKENEQIKGLSAEGITNVYNRAKSWQAKPGVPIFGYNSEAGLKGSINNFIRDELDNDIKRKEHVAKASHPSNIYAQKIQQAFEEKGVSISAKEALLHIDPQRYESLYGTPTVKVQEAVDEKVEKVAATSKPAAKAAAAATAAVAAAAKPDAKKTPTAAASSKPTPSKSTPKAETKSAKMTKQEVVDYYISKGGAGPFVKSPTDDPKLNLEALGEAHKQLTARKAKQQADAAKKRAATKAELDRVNREYEKRRFGQKAKPVPKEVDMDKLWKDFAQKQSLSIANPTRRAKEEEERKRK